MAFFPGPRCEGFNRFREKYDPPDPGEIRRKEDIYQKAFREAENLNLNFRYTIDSFDLVQLNDSLTRLIFKEN
ncbi:MAG: hypothetical protein KFF73_14105 [Cyclobacteriaceae bacterium]|nr:hypothetical protein [Cyclobacteriaceae bacterium]